MNEETTTKTTTPEPEAEQPGRPELLNVLLWLAAGAAAAYASYRLAQVAIARFACRDCEEQQQSAPADYPLHAFDPMLADATRCAHCGQHAGHEWHGGLAPRPAARPPEPEPERPATAVAHGGVAPAPAARPAVPTAAPPTQPRPRPADAGADADAAPELLVAELSAAEVLDGLAGGATSPGFARTFDEPGVGV